MEEDKVNLFNMIQKSILLLIYTNCFWIELYIIIKNNFIKEYQRNRLNYKILRIKT